MAFHREAKPTLGFIDEYCQLYEGIFPQVRSYEAFKSLHLGMVSEVKRKSLPAIAKAVGLKNSQSLLHFLTESPWTRDELRKRRLELMLRLLDGESLILLIDDSGDCKKGKSTDYVKRQYIGNVGKTENGIVAVTAYGLFRGMILPLSFEEYKPRERLKEGDKNRSKPQIAAEMIRGLQAMGFKFGLVLADCAYGEAQTNFVSVLEKMSLPYILAIRSDHGVWLSEDEEVYTEDWREFKRTFTNGSSETRYMKEVIYGKRRDKQYWLLTTDINTLPQNSTSFVMVSAPEVRLEEIGDSYGFRTWVEYGLKQAKDALGWADFRMTSYSQIEKWWEIVMSAFLMVSLFADQFNDSCPLAYEKFVQHPWWDHQTGWKNLLNNLRLVVQPLVCSHWLEPWLTVFPIPSLISGFEQLTTLMTSFFCPRVRTLLTDHHFSSA